MYGKYCDDWFALYSSALLLRSRWCARWYDYASVVRLVICLAIEAIAAEDVIGAAGDGSSGKDATAQQVSFEM